MGDRERARGSRRNREDLLGRAPKKYLTELAGPPTMELGGRRHPPFALFSSSPFLFPYFFFMNSKTEQLQCAYLSACMGRQSHVPISTIHFCPPEPQRRAALVPRTPPPARRLSFLSSYLSAGKLRLCLLPRPCHRHIPLYPPPLPRWTVSHG